MDRPEVKAAAEVVIEGEDEADITITMILLDGQVKWQQQVHLDPIKIFDNLSRHQTNYARKRALDHLPRHSQRNNPRPRRHHNPHPKLHLFESRPNQYVSLHRRANLWPHLHTNTSAMTW